MSKDEKYCRFSLFVPTLCSVSFEEDMRRYSETSSELFSNEFELYFIKLDQLKAYRNQVTYQNGLKKQKALWDFEEHLEASKVDVPKEFEQVCSSKSLTVKTFLNNSRIVKNC